MKDRLPEAFPELERDYQRLSWPVPSRDVVREALAQDRPVRFPVWRIAAAATVALLVAGWWLMRAAESPDAAVLAWEGDTVISQDVDRLQVRIDQATARPHWSVSGEPSISRRAATLRRRLDRLKKDIEPVPPKAGSPVGTYGETRNETEIV